MPFIYSLSFCCRFEVYRHVELRIPRLWFFQEALLRRVVPTMIGTACFTLSLLAPLSRVEYMDGHKLTTQFKALPSTQRYAETREWLRRFGVRCTYVSNTYHSDTWRRQFVWRRKPCYRKHNWSSCILPLIGPSPLHTIPPSLLRWSSLQDLHDDSGTKACMHERFWPSWSNTLIKHFVSSGKEGMSLRLTKPALA